MSAERVKELLNKGERLRKNLGRGCDCAYHDDRCARCDAILAMKEWEGFDELRALLSLAVTESEKLREHVELVCRERDLLREEVKGLREGGVPAES